MLAAREASLTSYIDGVLVNQVTDLPRRSGPMALWVPEGMAAFRDPRIRFMN